MQTAFKTEKIDDPETFLQVIQEGEQFVRNALKEDEDGIYLTDRKGPEKDNFYAGTAGILHLYLQLYQMQPLDIYKQIIYGLISYLDAHALDAVNLSKTHKERVPGMTKSFYTGLAGIGLILNEAVRQFHLANAVSGAYKILSYYQKETIKCSDGIYWTDNAPVYFDSGILLYLIDTVQTFPDLKASLFTQIEAAANHILSEGTWHTDHCLEIDHIHLSFKHQEPNFEFGTAGIGYTLLKVYETIGNKKYLYAAKAAAKYLKSIAVKQKNGFLIPYKLGKYDHLFYLGNCHGPVGTVKLFYELFLVTKDKQYLKDALSLCQGAKSLGAPFYQSPGFWNTTCFCCGPAGYIPMYIGMYFLTNDIRWKESAHQVGELLAGQRTISNTYPVVAHWELAFDRTDPKTITSPVGYYPGAAGIIAVLSQLYMLETEKTQLPGLIDDPYLRHSI